MNFLRMIPIAMVVIGAIVTVALSVIPGDAHEPSSFEVTTLEATPQKLVLLVHWGSKPASVEDFRRVNRLGAEHCKKFDRDAGQTSFSLNIGSVAGEATIPCVGNNKAVNETLKETENPKKAQKRKRSPLLKAWE